MHGGVPREHYWPFWDFLSLGSPRRTLNFVTHLCVVKSLSFFDTFPSIENVKLTLGLSGSGSYLP